MRCFAPELVSPADPFAPWPVLNLPRSLRFVGTVNFDETTRQLSQRVLDRANLIRLHPLYLLDAREVSLVRPSGPTVTLRRFRDWVAADSTTLLRGLDASVGATLDQLKEPLARFGCPLNQRRFNAIRKLLGNTPPEVCTLEQALDLQIAQRLLPQARNLFRPGARQALAAVRKVLQARPSAFAESLQLIDEIEDERVPRGPAGRRRQGVSGPAVFRLTRNGNPIASLPLGEGEQMGDEQNAVTVNELQRCGFQVDQREPETEYHLWIGDRDPVRSNEAGMVRLEGGTAAPRSTGTTAPTSMALAAGSGSDSPVARAHLRKIGFSGPGCPSTSAPRSSPRIATTPCWPSCAAWRPAWCSTWCRRWSAPWG